MAVIQRVKHLVFDLFYILSVPVLFFYVLFSPKSRDTLIWGTTPIINNKYWSDAMKGAGYRSCTFMDGFLSINKKSDFDLYLQDTVPRFFVGPLKDMTKNIFAMCYVVRHASVLHMSFYGGPLGDTVIWKLEALLLKMARIKVIIIPYGSDAYRYSSLSDALLKTGLLLSYPDAARKETEIAEHVEYWVRYADIILTGYMFEGIGRWDVTLPQVLCINTHIWSPKITYSQNDGQNGVVRILHTPNHRGFKGTEFLIDAVEKLKNEGLRIELILCENLPNDRVREMMGEVDILAEQFIAPYAMSGLEGMSSGLPVMTNMSNDQYLRVFRLYSYLNECPILSTTPETLKENLRVLVTHPELREQLGKAGRQYVEKYHSEETAQYLFGSIYRKILKGEDVDLMNLFHPLKSEYNHRKPVIDHPLCENKLPGEYYR